MPKYISLDQIIEALAEQVTKVTSLIEIIQTPNHPLFRLVPVNQVIVYLNEAVHDAIAVKELYDRTISTRMLNGVSIEDKPWYREDWAIETFKWSAMALGVVSSVALLRMAATPSEDDVRRLERSADAGEKKLLSDASSQPMVIFARKEDVLKTDWDGQPILTSVTMAPRDSLYRTPAGYTPLGQPIVVFGAGPQVAPAPWSM